MSHESDVSDSKPCRTCTDFKSYSKKNKISKEDTEILKLLRDRSQKECPVDKDELGRSTWNLLHTITAAYPETPNDEDKKRISDFFRIFAKNYPCDVCAADFQKQIERFPPKTASQYELSQWLCRAHNRINLRIGKPQFDCAKVNERWRDGWKDGSCD